MNDDFISSSIETGMRVPGEPGAPGGGTGGVGGGGEEPSMVSMRWPQNLSRRRRQVTARERAGRPATEPESRSRSSHPQLEAPTKQASTERPSWMKTAQSASSISPPAIVLATTVATVVSGKQTRSVREVMLCLPSEPTFPSKIKTRSPKKAQFQIFFLASLRGGPKMFRLLQCARIAEQHWVSTEANT